VRSHAFHFSEIIRAAVGDDWADAAAGRNRTLLDAVLALRVAPVHGDVIAVALRRELPVAISAVVAAWPRAWCAHTHACLVKNV
jgi:hypothetical protein